MTSHMDNRELTAKSLPTLKIGSRVRCTDVEGNDGRQVGLTIGTAWARYLNNAIDAFGRRRGAVGGWVSFVSSWLLRTRLEITSAKGSGLPMGLSSCLIELLAKAVIFILEVSDATLQASNGSVAFGTTDAREKSHDHPPSRFWRKGMSSRCGVVLHHHHTTAVKDLSRT